MTDEPIETTLTETSTTAEAVVEGAPLSTPDESSPETIETAGAAGVDRGDGRDVHGKFVGKGEAPADDPAEAAVGTETPPPVDPNAPLTPIEGDTIPPVTDAPVEAPFAVKAVGQEWEIPGSKVTKDGIFIPTASRELVEKYIGKGVKYETVEQQTRQQRAELQVEVARLKGFEQAIAQLEQIAAIPDDQQFAEAALAAMLEFRDSLPTLKREAELNAREARFQMQQALHQPDADEQRELIEREMVSSVDELLHDMRQHQDFAALTERDYADLKTAILRDSRLYFYQAGDRLSAEEQAAGINPGDRVFDMRRAIAEGRRIHTIRSEAKAEAEAARKAAAEAKRVAEQNAKKLEAAKARVAPVAPAAKPAPASDQPTTDRAAAREAYLRDMGLLV